METLIKEINNFLINSNYPKCKKSNYQNILMELAKSLANLTDTAVEEINLEEFYKKYDIKVQFITFKPSNLLLIDNYFETYMNRGYNCIKCNKGALTSFCNYLIRKHNYPNILQEINFNNHKNNQFPTLTKKNVIKLFNNIVSESKNVDRDMLLFNLLFRTGSRVSEVANLKVMDIDYDKELIFFSINKNRNKNRIIPIENELISSIKTYCIKNKLLDSNNLFDLTPTHIRNLFYSFLKMANLPKVNIGSIRHSYARTMIESGASVTTVAQFLGHSNIASTIRFCSVKLNFVSNLSFTINENDDIFFFIRKK